MADFYQDASRHRLFAEHAQERGPLSGPEMCQVDLLEWSPGQITRHPPVVEINAQALRSRAQPRLQIIFAPLDVPQPKSAAGIGAIFEHYRIPSDFISQRLESVTHSFNAIYDGADCCFWLHFLCKSVSLRNDPGGPMRIVDPRNNNEVLSQADWTWIRTSIFMRWNDCHERDKASVTLVVFSASPELRARCQGLWNNDLSGVLVDPFSLLVICMDELWLQAQGIVRDVSNIFGRMERTALDFAATAVAESDDSHHDFVGLHNIAKHIIYLKENADAAALTMSHLQDFHKELSKQPPQGHHAIPTMRLTGQMLGQKAVQFEVWKLRMTSLEKRIQNVINLSFNVVTQRDSHVLKGDSRSMKAIATVTMAFLPLATVATVFGTEFFNYDEAKNKVTVTNDFWIFWALIGPLSLVVSSVYYYLCYFRGQKRRALPRVFSLKRAISS